MKLADCHPEVEVKIKQISVELLSHMRGSWREMGCWISECLCLCRNCIASRDPYCGWTRGSTCSFLRPGTRYDTFPYIYTSIHAVYSTCPGSPYWHAVCLVLSLRPSQVLSPFLVLSLRSNCLFVLVCFFYLFCFHWICFYFYHSCRGYFSDSTPSGAPIESLHVL